MIEKQIRIKDPLAIAEERNWGRCRICKKGGYLHVHHIRHRGGGGDDVPENLIALCPECHQRTHNGLIPKAELLGAKIPI